jgi:hypothetical protein
MRSFKLASLIALALTVSVAAADDRPPTPEERARIMKALEALGYTSVGEIEIEGNRVEVDDALDKKGHRYDLKLDAKTLKVIRKEREHD